MPDIRLEAGDVLLIVGPRECVDGLSNNSDLLLMTWAIREMPALQRAHRAGLIFIGTVALAASGLLPISIAAVTGALARIAAERTDGTKTELPSLTRLAYH